MLNHWITFELFNIVMLCHLIKPFWITMKKYMIESFVLVSIFCVLLLLYWKLIWGSYVLNDDWSFFSYTPRGLFSGHPQATFYIIVGREAYLIIGSIMERLISGLTSLSFVRVLSFFLVFFSAFKLSSLIKNRTLSNSLLIILAILPSSFVNIEWVTMFPFVLSMAFSIISFFYIYESHSIKKNAIGIGLLLFSIFCYQPYCFFFIVPAFVMALYDPRVVIRTELLRVMFFFICSLILYWFIQSQLILPYLLERKEFADIYNQLGVFKPELSHNPFERLIDLVSRRFEFLINPFVQFGKIGNLISWLIGTFFLLTCLLSPKFFLLRLSIFILFSFFVMTPYILSENGHDGFRVMAVQSTGAVIFFIFILEALYKKMIIFKLKCGASVLLFSFLIALFINQWVYANNVAEYYSEEYSYLKRVIDSYNGGSICLITLKSRQTYGDQKQLGNGEFFHNTFSDLNNTTIAINFILQNKYPRLYPSGANQENGNYVYLNDDCSKDELFEVDMNKLRINN